MLALVAICGSECRIGSAPASASSFEAALASFWSAVSQASTDARARSNASRKDVVLFSASARKALPK